MNIQFVRLELDVCEPLNRMAMDQKQTVSDLVNEVLRAFLKAREESSATEGTGAR